MLVLAEPRQLLIIVMMPTISLENAKDAPLTSGEVQLGIVYLSLSLKLK